MTTQDKRPAPPSPAPDQSAQAGELLVVTSEQLFKDQKSIRIAHQGQYYLLRITRENKLILTK